MEVSKLVRTNINSCLAWSISTQTFNTANNMEDWTKQHCISRSISRFPIDSPGYLVSYQKQHSVRCLDGMIGF